LVGPGAGELAGALAAGEVVGVPAVGGYCLAVRAGSPDAAARLDALNADPDGPHYAVGHRDAVRSLTSGWTDEVRQLLERCWPGPLEVLLPLAPSVGDGAPEGPEGREGQVVEGEPRHGAWAAVVGMSDGRTLRKLCRELGPWRTVPLTFTDAAEVAHAFDATDVVVVVDGGRRQGLPPTLVDGTVSPIRVLREGALPASFIEATMLMSARRRWFSRSSRPRRSDSP
jgi:L-threonylcarbamoyladenylate synthase